MEEKKQGIDWTTLWKKDDWMSVWIGFLILIIFMAGATFKLPGWKWMTDGAFFEKAAGAASKVEALAKDAEGKGEQNVQKELLALKTAIDGKDRKAIGDAAGKVEKAAKDAKDKDIAKKAGKVGKDMKGDAGNTIGKILSGANLLKALYLLIGLWILGGISMSIMVRTSGKFTLGSPILLFLRSPSSFVLVMSPSPFSLLYVVFSSPTFTLTITHPRWSPLIL